MEEDLFNWYLKVLDSSKLKSRVRTKVCWNKIRTSPTLNSTAERIRKKKVNETKFKLSKKKPNSKVKAYKVIQINSAVNRRCRAEFV